MRYNYLLKIVILEADYTDTDMHSKDYHIIAADLGDTNLLLKKLNDIGIDQSLPTLFIAESVLVYMSDAYTNNLLRWITQRFQSACFITCIW